MAERRHATRQKSFLRGCVFFNKRRGAMDCLIRDISADGARIIFSGAVSVPDIVELCIPQKEETVRARVKWRRGDEVGLAFTAAEGAAAAPGADDGDLARRSRSSRPRSPRCGACSGSSSTSLAALARTRRSSRVCQSGSPAKRRIHSRRGRRICIDRDLHQS